MLNNKAPQTSGNGNGKAPIPDQSLQSRLMTAAELKALQKQQAKAAAVRKVVPAVPTEPKGTISTPATNVAIPLAKRITLPLAMRLNEEAKKNGYVSSTCFLLIAKRLTSQSRFYITDQPVVSRQED